MYQKKKNKNEELNQINEAKLLAKVSKMRAALFELLKQLTVRGKANWTAKQLSLLIFYHGHIYCKYNIRSRGYITT